MHATMTRAIKSNEKDNLLLLQPNALQKKKHARLTPLALCHGRGRPASTSGIC
jgi:hypothetical protein